jgi:hypothetical protein
MVTCQLSADYLTVGLSVADSSVSAKGVMRFTIDAPGLSCIARRKWKTTSFFAAAARQAIQLLTCGQMMALGRLILVFIEKGGFTKNKSAPCAKVVIRGAFSGLYNVSTT